MKSGLKRQDLIYPELSYEIIGSLFEVYNQLGSGHYEDYYQKALAVEFKKRSILFKEEVYVPLIFKEEKIGKRYLDFLIENKVILEIKKGDRFSRRHIEQIKNYLKIKRLKLGIIANFGSKELKFKRIINFNS